ncbi:MAG: hypothetical protein JO185_16095 [Acidobacteriaceae bacterium]|nr:hypothetical protein [Acidobacteriaceae bacterium]
MITRSRPSRIGTDSSLLVFFRAFITQVQTTEAIQNDNDVADWLAGVDRETSRQSVLTRVMRMQNAA